jgi:hypothetical protein
MALKAIPNQASVRGRARFLSRDRKRMNCGEASMLEF